MGEGPRLEQTGSVGGVPVYTDVTSIGGAVAVRVVIGAVDYISTSPPGFPDRPHNTGAAIAEGANKRALIAGRLATLQHGSNRYRKKVESCNQDSITQAEAAALLGVGKTSVESAVVVPSSRSRPVRPTHFFRRRLRH